MQIRPITRNISFTESRNNTSFTPSENNSVLQKSTQPFVGDIYLSGEILDKQAAENDFFNTFLKKPGKVTKEEYIDVLNNHPVTLVKASKQLDNTALASKPKTIAKAAICLKDGFNSEFDNYRLISIGTSPSPICEVMNLMGCEVVFIPASGLGAYDKNIIETYRQIGQERFENIPKICEYLKNKGVKKDNSTKNILLDYTSSGKSLDNMRTILIDYNGVNPSDIFCCSIIDYLSQAAKKEGLISNKDIECIKSDMATCSIDSISNTPHFYIEDVLNCCYATCSKDWICAENKTTEELRVEFENFSKPSARAFSLSAINEARKITEQKGGKNFTQISFCSKYSQKNRQNFEEFTLKKGKITPEEYEDILKKHIDYFIKAFDKVKREKTGLETTPLIVSKCAVNLKKYFDNRFKDYKIISIGTSPSAISEVMENLGCEVIYLPLTGLRRISTLDILEMNKETLDKKNISLIIEYLKEKGINAANDNKKNILLDYSASGQTFDNVKAILQYYNKIPSANMYSCSLIDDLNFYGLMPDCSINKLQLDMCFSDIFKISNTPHFYLIDKKNQIHSNSVIAHEKSQKEVFKEFEDFSQPYARAFSLCAIAGARELKLLKKIRG